ncbi:MAG: hypothetical protein ACO1OD_11290 [Croceibacterium sp.]
MTSIEIVAVAAAVVAVLVAPIVFLNWRYRRYEQRRARGHRTQKPVWKPFWME